jgi:predicted ATPase
MIINIRMTGKWAKRVGAKTQRTFEFKPGVNLLVGPNGSGKSSIIAAIKAHVSIRDRKNKLAEKAPIETSAPIKILMMDFEKDNPRTKSYLMGGGTTGFQVGSMYCSHGETTRAIVKGFESDEMKDVLVIVDEPDQALDFDGVKLLIEKLRASPAAQMIVSVHHPLVVLSEFHVIELEQGYRARVREEMKGLIAKS